MRELELRRILRSVAVVTSVMLGVWTIPTVTGAQQQTDEPTPIQDMEREIGQAADDAGDGADWGWLGLLGLAGLLGLRRRDDTRTIDTETRRY